MLNMKIENLPNYKILIKKNLYTDILNKPYIYTNTITSLEYINNYDTYIRNNKQNNDCNQIKYEEEFTNCESTICNPEDSIINCIFYNISNCKYDFIEFIDIKDNKLVLYIVPHNGLNQEEKNSLYIGNILDLDGSNINMMLMLNIIKNKYSNKNYCCLLHISKTFMYYCLHFHIFKNDYYKRVYPELEMGNYMIQDMLIDKVINNLEVNKNYYKNLQFNLIKQY
jgi:hypothetical protein